MTTDIAPHPDPIPAVTGIAAVPRDRRPRLARMAGRAPVRPTPVAAAHNVSAAAAALLALVAIGAALHEPVLIPALAASAALVH
ncbi:hypothetical protein ABZ567_30245 [Streptomyces sp. NPDC016459]|uniref:hypothetical protein n=1 Tax=Streptomyces sp. NPDC016459 TaxID=3157190 RepID=UPI0033DEB616